MFLHRWHTHDARRSKSSPESSRTTSANTFRLSELRIELSSSILLSTRLGYASLKNTYATEREKGRKENNKNVFLSLSHFQTKRHQPVFSSLCTHALSLV
jgi:hypothetical protein